MKKSKWGAIISRPPTNFCSYSRKKWSKKRKIGSIYQHKSTTIHRHHFNGENLKWGATPKTLTLPILGRGEAQNVKLEAQFINPDFRGKILMGLGGYCFTDHRKLLFISQEKWSTKHTIGNTFQHKWSPIHGHYSRPKILNRWGQWNVHDPFGSKIWDIIKMKFFIDMISTWFVKSKSL